MLLKRQTSTSIQIDNDIQTALRTIFQLDELRNLQPQAVRNALHSKSQMIVMATGGGKSLCYQLPACILGGVTIVISPLLALMKDQTEELNKKGIPAACINSSQTETQNKAILQRLVPSLYSLIFDDDKQKEESTTRKTTTMSCIIIYYTGIHPDRSYEDGVTNFA